MSKQQVIARILTDHNFRNAVLSDPHSTQLKALGIPESEIAGLRASLQKLMDEVEVLDDRTAKMEDCCHANYQHNQTLLAK